MFFGGFLRQIIVIPMPKTIKKKLENGTKIFVLDTSVILYDHNAILNFEEHDIAIPITVLEELDNFKKGNDTLNFEAREFIRFVDKLSTGTALSGWISLAPRAGGAFSVIMDERSSLDATKVFGDKKAVKVISSGDESIFSGCEKL
jgi:PhoH-like ATPase